jgi:hypothetical protein
MTCIGVTGHRSLGDSAPIADAVDNVLGRIRSVFPAPFEICSPLAAGADQLVAGRAMHLLDACLVVPLPMSLPQYLQDFSPASVIRLTSLIQQASEVIHLQFQPGSQDAYATAGWFMLDRIQVLISIWDGHPARGPGGTGQITAEARRRRMPLAWIQVGAPHAEVVVRYEHFDPASPTGPGEPAA